MVIDMKLSVGKRILMFVHWLVSLLFVAAFAVYVIAPNCVMQYYNRLVDAVGMTYVKVIGIAILAVYAALAIAQVILIFKRKKRSERGFITVDSSDSGRVRIAISAIEQMVRQSVGAIDGLTDMKIGIENLDDAIGIRVKASIVNGSHVPTITMNMQRAIRQFVETNCGVAVREVSISINAVTGQGEAPKRLRRKKGQEPLTIAPAAQTIADTGYAAPQGEPEAKAEEAPERYEAPEAKPAVFVAPEVKPEPEPEPIEESAPAFDLDAPYESQFAKDLAAMKAAEASRAEDGDSAYEDEALEEDEI